MRHVIGAALVWAVNVSAQPAGTFTATGSMTTPRVNHTATLLTNGKVLIAGGFQRVLPEAALASAELYDPSLGTFTAIGSMTKARAQHTATLLPDGRVLVVGGSTDPSAEIYDPATGVFSATANPVARPFPSFRPSTALLKDGRVLIAAQPTAEIYDPVSGTFLATGPYAGPLPTWIQSATLLPDGRVLLIANDAQVYDPGSGTFAHGGAMNYSYDVLTATLLTSGRVLSVGSEENDGIPSDAEIFDPLQGSFTPTAKARENHEYAAAILLPDGSVLITGGQIPGGKGNAVSELYDPASGTFSAAGNMLTPRHEHTATLLNDGTVLIAGGFNLYPAATSSAELYRPAVLVSAPLLFSPWHSAGRIVSPDEPAVAGEALSMYTSGLGQDSVIPPQVAMGGRLAEILYFGEAPGYPGFRQVNIRVPGGISPRSLVAVRLTYLGRPSNEIPVAVQ